MTRGDRTASHHPTPELSMRQPRQSLPLVSAEPMQVLVRRAGAVESLHAVDIAVCDADGSVLVGLGEIERPIFPRSAMKPLQAIALAEKSIDLSAQKKLTPAEYSLICASHNGQRLHVDAARHLLAKFDLSPELLVCGAHWSSDEPTAINQIRSLEVPATIHNNCSGKHAGMLVLAALLGTSLDGYAALSHPVQQSILGTLEAMTGIDLMQFPHGVDGCGAPAISGPLGNWARGFALFADSAAMPPHRAIACALLRDGIAAAPEMIAGDRRLCSALAATYGQQITAKVGAEGVYGAAFHDLELGLMMKCRDGNRRAIEVSLGAIIHLLGYDCPLALFDYFTPQLKNWAGEKVGDIVIEGALAPAVMRQP